MQGIFWERLSKYLLLLLLPAALLLSVGSHSQAASVTLAWEYADFESVDGFRIYMRTEGQAYDYQQPAWQGDQLTCTLSGLTSDFQYYFVARVYAGEQESADSNEVSWPIGGGTVPPALASVGQLRIVEMAGNNFLIDPSCKALWRFEPDGLGIDSTGGKPLAVFGAPVADTQVFREGFSSARFRPASKDYLGAENSDLVAGFPLKAGDTNKKISVVCWVRIPQAVAVMQYIWAKWDTTGSGYRSMGVNLNNSLRVLKAYDGTNYEQLSTEVHLAANVWYHIGVTYDDATRKVSVRLYNSATDQAQTFSATQTRSIVTNSVDLTISAKSPGTAYFDGWLDEMAVFNRVLSVEEIDRIRNKIFGR